MTLDRIHEAYSNTFFCQLSKWGSALSLGEAKKIGLPVDEVNEEEKATPTKRPARKPKNNNTKNNKEE